MGLSSHIRVGRKKRGLGFQIQIPAESRSRKPARSQARKRRRGRDGTVASACGTPGRWSGGQGMTVEMKRGEREEHVVM